MAETTTTNETKETNETNTKKSRLIITNLILENFKSYAGVQEIGPLHKSFSCVVGPNGSGKSNVIDAMLFVFGYRAKKIRLNKVSELIHNSENHRNLDSARVSVHFVEIDCQTEEIVPNSEFVLSRTAHRDNSSKYFFNNKPSSFVEVTDLLKQRGIDLDHNRFLILQGEVEQISMMKPKAQTPHEEGLLNYLEDIIGSNIYIERIEEAGKQLDVCNEARADKLARCKNVEKEKESLESSKIEAQEFMKVQRSIDSRNAVICQLNLSVYQKKASETEAARINAENQLEEEKAKMKETNEKLLVLEDKFNKELKEHELLAKGLQKTKSEFNAYERKDIKGREDLKNAVSKEKKCQANIEKEKQKARDLTMTVEKHTRDISQAENEIKNLNKSLTKESTVLDEIYDDLKKETGPWLIELDSAQKKLLPLREKVDNAKSVVDVIEGEIKLLQKKTSARDTMISEIKTQTESSRAKHIDLKKEEASLVEKENNLKQKNEELKSKKKELETKENNLIQRLKEKRSKMESAKSNNNEVAAKSQVLQGIMQASKKGKLKGVYGRIGDLGIIDAKYDVAISTACGSLDHILVETAEDGQKCVDFLKQNNLGRSTFHMLEKITANYGNRINESVQTPENVPRLFDLVKTKDEKFKAVFRFVLGDTLVANSLEQATRVAFEGSKRYRVVTLDGKLIDTSGTMSGGGNKVLRGGMASSFSSSSSSSASSASSSDGSDDGVITDKELAEMQKDIDQNAALLKKIQAELENIRNELGSLSEELQKISMELLPKCRMEMTSLTKLLVELAERVTMINEQYKPNPADLSRLKECEKEIEVKQRDFDKMKDLASNAEDEVAEIQRKIDEKGGMRLKTQKSKVDGINGQMDTQSSNVTKATVQLKAAEKAVGKCQEALVEQEEEASKIAEFVTKTKNELKELEIEAAKVMEAYNETKRMLEIKDEHLQVAKGEYEELKTTVNKAKSLQVDLENKLDECLRNQRESNDRVKMYVKELAALKKRHEKEISDLAEEIDAIDADTQEELKKMEEYFDLSAEELSRYNIHTVEKEISMFEESLSSMKPNMGAIKAYKKKAEEYKTRVTELNEATEERDKCRKIHDGLRKQRLDEFMKGFSFITMKLKEMYQMITLGGDAELELVDSLDPFSEGIVFSVRPPKKSWKNIQNLSGGEKTLSSLALVFALHQYKPTPLYVMDEIDAALDFKNVSIVANYLKDRTKDAQFIIISLRNNMFELADRLVGIYKTNNATKSVTIDPAAFVIPSASVATAKV